MFLAAIEESTGLSKKGLEMPSGQPRRPERNKNLARIVKQVLYNILKCTGNFTILFFVDTDKKETILCLALKCR